MFRTFLAVAAAAAVVSAPSIASASAAPAMCQGEEATIVGTPGADTLRGTSSRDVIVTNSAFEVQAGDGDDLICVTGEEAGNIYAGRGDDDVHIQTSHGYGAWAELGPGADTFHGDKGRDTVWAGDERDELVDARDAERDVIATGRGPDMVIAGEPDMPFLDQIETGPGDDWLTVAATVGDGTGMLDAGDGYDVLGFSWPEAVGGSWLFDNGAQMMTKDGTAQLGWAGVETFHLPDLRTNPVSFHGSDRAEFVTAAGFARIELRGGADGFQANSSYLEQEADSGLVDGGAGRDVFVADTFDDAFVDLAEGVARFAEAYLNDVQLTAVEDVTTYGGRGTVIIRGSDADNVIRSDACRLTAGGADGDDRLISTATECFEGERASLRGGSDSDLLRGSGTPDRLRGGPGEDRMFGRGGRDVADGGDGRDICAAELRRSCRKP